MYGDQEFINKLEPGRVKVMTGPLARNLYISNSRLIEAMEWLKTLGTIEKIDYPIRGVALITVKFPPMMENTDG